MNTSKFDPKVYEAFLRSKIPPSAECGFPCEPSEVNPICKPHQKDGICWAVRRGRAALFEAFGLGKTIQQLEFCRLILAKVAAARKQEELFPFCRALIVAPLGVRQEFKHDAEMLERRAVVAHQPAGLLVFAEVAGEGADGRAPV